MFLANIRNNKLDGISACKCLSEGLKQIEITEELFNSIASMTEIERLAHKYIVVEVEKEGVKTKEIVLNPNFEKEKQAIEQEHIKELTCTKRVFALMLKELGIGYTQLKELIASNEDAQLEWDLCEKLLRGNPLLDVMAIQLGITPYQLDKLFLYANGEITLEEFKE